jgi:hypothetical protein
MFKPLLHRHFHLKSASGRNRTHELTKTVGQRFPVCCLVTRPQRCYGLHLLIHIWHIWLDTSDYNLIQHHNLLCLPIYFQFIEKFQKPLNQPNSTSKIISSLFHIILPSKCHSAAVKEKYRKYIIFLKSLNYRLKNCSAENVFVTVDRWALLVSMIIIDGLFFLFPQKLRDIRYTQNCSISLNICPYQQSWIFF